MIFIGDYKIVDVLCTVSLLEAACKLVFRCAVKQVNASVKTLLRHGNNAGKAAEMRNRGSSLNETAPALFPVLSLHK